MVQRVESGGREDPASASRRPSAASSFHASSMISVEPPAPPNGPPRPLESRSRPSQTPRPCRGGDAGDRGVEQPRAVHVGGQPCALALLTTSSMRPSSRWRRRPCRRSARPRPRSASGWYRGAVAAPPCTWPAGVDRRRHHRREHDAGERGIRAPPRGDRGVLMRQISSPGRQCASL